MSSTVGALRAVPEFASERAVQMLRQALDEQVLRELGWDAEALVVHRVIEHPSFGVPECEVEGCSGLAADARCLHFVPAAVRAVACGGALR